MKNFAKSLNHACRKSFEMSMMGELNYFLGLQIKQMSDGIFINQAKNTRELIKKFGLEGAKSSKTLMVTTTKLEKNEQGINVDNDILIVQIYVDDIIFGSTNEKFCKEFESCMKKGFEMSMMGELNYFLGL